MQSFPKKFLTPDTHTAYVYQGFSENFAYLLNERFLKKQLIMHCFHDKSLQNIFDEISVPI